MARTKWVTVAELSAILGVPRHRIYARSRTGKALAHIRTTGKKLELDLDWFVSDFQQSEAQNQVIGQRREAQLRRTRRKNEADARRTIPATPASDVPTLGPAFAINKSDREAPTYQPMAASPDVGYVDHLNERRRWAAKRERLRYEAEVGNLCSRERVRAEGFEVARLARDQLLAIPDRVSGLLAGAKTSDACFEILDKELRRALGDLCDAIEQIEERDDGHTSESDEGGPDASQDHNGL